MPFNRAEYRMRLQRTKEEMVRRSLDVLISTNPANMHYLTGYDGYSFYVIQGVIVSLDEEEPVWLGREMDLPGAALSVWMQPGQLLSYSDDYVQSDVKHPMHVFADVLKQKGLAAKRIGLEMAQDPFTPASFEALKSRLPDARFADASFLINRVRMVKSEAEISCMKRAGAITAAAVRTAADSIAEGVREADVAAAVYDTLIRGTDGETGDYPAIIPLLSANERIAAPHLSWTERLYQKKDLISLELSGCVRRYHAPLARTIHVGPAPPVYREITETVLEGLEAMLETVKAGVTCEEVADSWKRVLARTRLTKDSRVGYPIGIGYPPDWGEQTLSIRSGDRTVLEPNMTLHLLPALFEETAGFVVSESVRVTAAGCERLADLPRELIIK